MQEQQQQQQIPQKMIGAIQYAWGGPDVLQVSNDLPVPQISKHKDVLVKMHAAGVNGADGATRAYVYCCCCCYGYGYYCYYYLFL